MRTVPAPTASTTLWPCTGTGDVCGTDGGVTPGAGASGGIRPTPGEGIAPAALGATTRIRCDVAGVSPLSASDTGTAPVPAPTFRLLSARHVPSASCNSARTSVSTPFGVTLALIVAVVAEAALALVAVASGGTVTRTR